MEESSYPNARPLRIDERNLLRQLLKIAGWSEARQTACEHMLVSDLNGGMGSVRFVSDVEGDARRFGRRIAELEFADDDGATVVASLNVDQDGRLFEIDIWKTDFGSVIRYPKS